MLARRLQAWVLRLVGAVEVLALGAVVMPRAWMASMHERLGMGPLPEGPVFESVMRQVSFSYGLHGIALWFIAWDVVRYRPLVVLTGLGYIVAAPTFFLVDYSLGMPVAWHGGNAGSCLLIGCLLLGLLWWEKASVEPARVEA